MSAPKKRKRSRWMVTFTVDARILAAVVLVLVLVVASSH